ncbi:zinc finger protein weckle-like [Phlebotomus argentipes]|uniref:zinc finger protein weckle-like n=1 Tax=Phlebotomus argentipes TaxID=94469 RepID=UPI0028931354|nr:zinc finger protein weckle-like [Phlebotomus argentipes]
MLRNWKNWCRLCAKNNSAQAEVLYKSESSRNPLEIANKYFLSILPLDGTQLGVCQECCSFLVKVDDFHEHCLRVDHMFRELIELETPSEMQLESIRFKHGLEDEEIKYSPVFTGDLEEATKQESPSLCQSPNPLEMQIEKALFVKLEEPEMDFVPVQKKRGRPKRSLEVVKNDDEDAEAAPRKRKKIWKGPREKKHLCTLCPKRFNRPHLLREHTIEEHRQEEMAYVCTSCSKRFSCEKKLKMHEISHLPVSEGLIYPCPHCDKKFNHKYKIPSHIRAMHSGDKPFVCEECGNSFKTRSALNAHQVSHVEERTFQCTNCPKRFKNQRALKRHDEDTHQDTVHACPHCDVKLKNRRTFRSHLLVHSDVKKYKCNYCGSEYKRRKTFKDHLILHTGQRPYQCPFCDKTFANGSNCTSHKKKAHPVELAALEASGEPLRIAILPRLEHLQAKSVLNKS